MLKVLEQKHGAAAKATQERLIASRIRDRLSKQGSRQNVVRFQAIDDESNSSEPMVVEFCNAGDLQRLVVRCQDHKQKLTSFEVCTVATRSSRL
jgi:hypothetical protein